MWASDRPGVQPMALRVSKRGRTEGPRTERTHRPRDARRDAELGWASNRRTPSFEARGDRYRNLTEKWWRARDRSVTLQDSRRLRPGRPTSICAIIGPARIDNLREPRAAWRHFHVGRSS